MYYTTFYIKNVRPLSPALTWDLPTCKNVRPLMYSIQSRGKHVTWETGTSEVKLFHIGEFNKYWGGGGVKSRIWLEVILWFLWCVQFFFTKCYITATTFEETLEKKFICICYKNQFWFDLSFKKSKNGYPWIPCWQKLERLKTTVASRWISGL